MNVREKTGLEWPAPAEIEIHIIWALREYDREHPYTLPAGLRRVIRSGINEAIRAHLEDKK